jgi:TRAP-type C4-dicarboxylate transport system permease small subunit
MRKLYERFVKVLEIFSTLLSIAMLAIVLVGVFYRYVMDDSLSWYDEFAGYVLVWLTMYGSVVALAKRKHISFDTLVEKLPPRARRWADVFGILCVMAFSVVMLVSGFELVREMADETAISVPTFKMAWIYSVMPVTGGLMLLIGLVQLVQALAGGERKLPKYVAPVEPSKTVVETE